MGGDGENEKVRGRMERISEDLSWKERRVRWKLGDSENGRGEGKKSLSGGGMRRERC